MGGGARGREWWGTTDRPPEHPIVFFILTNTISEALTSLRSSHFRIVEEAKGPLAHLCFKIAYLKKLLLE